MQRKKPESVPTLEALGRERLSESFYMREFLYSEIAVIEGIPNIPDNPSLAIEAGRRLCEELLEPLNATFGRVAVRSSYRSPGVNQAGVGRYNCASNESNRARHIWDQRDDEGIGATACVSIPWFTDKYVNGADWRSLAYWIHDHLPYSELEFFDGKGMCTFNITWHETQKKTITSWIGGKSVLLKNAHEEHGFERWYEGFPTMRQVSTPPMPSGWPLKIASSPFRSSDQLREAQVTLFLMFANDLVESFGSLRQRGNEEAELNNFLGSKEYSRFVKGAYGCGFVCSDLAPDLSMDVLRHRAAKDLSLAELRHCMHTLLRSERHSSGYGSPVLESIQSGSLQQVLKELEHHVRAAE